MSSGKELSERAASSSGAGPRVVVMRREPIPLDLLVVKEDLTKYERGVIQSREQMKRSQREINWASKREQVVAAVAAGFHVLTFAVNLAFWGTEGMPPDRYWPNNPRIRLGLQPGRYGNLEGSSRIYMDNLARVEGAYTPL